MGSSGESCMVLSQLCSLLLEPTTAGPRMLRVAPHGRLHLVWGKVASHGALIMHRECLGAGLNSWHVGPLGL